MPSECPICHEFAVDAETGGELVCHECGAVVESRVFNFENDSREGCTFMSRDGSARFDGRYELSRNLRQRLPTGDSSLSRKRLQLCLTTVVTKLNLSAEIFNKTRELMFGKVLPLRSSKEVRGLPLRRNIFVGSCLFIVCRQNNIQLTYRHMAEAAECNMFQLGKSVKNVLKALDIKLDPLSVESIILRILSELSVLDTPYEKMCLDLYQIFKCFGLSVARNQAAKAMGLVLLVLEGQKVSPTKEKISEIMGKISLTQAQLKEDMSRTKTSLLELAKEVPWIPDSVKKKDIVKHIVAIVNFHKKCGKLDLSVVKSLWLKKRESSDKNRKAKIQMAKARILNKEQVEPGCSVNAEINNPMPPTSLAISDESTCDYGNTSDTANNGDMTTCSEDSLDHNDKLIEHLLKCGYTEEELMDGYFESRMCDLQSSEQLDPEGEREDLDEMDIADREMHHYLWSVAEMERLKNLKE